MAATAGIGGMVQWNGQVVANIDTWAISPKGTIVKTTSFGATGSWDTNIAALRDWTATCSGQLDPADPTGQAVLLNGLGTSFTLFLGTQSTTHGWSGPAIVVGLDPKASVGGSVTVSISFEGNGALTFI